MQCVSCENLYCHDCNPHFDWVGDTCQACQEQEQIQRLAEDKFTGKLRIWFNKPAHVLPVPAMRSPLPWKLNGQHVQSVTGVDGGGVAVFNAFEEALYAVNAANKNHAMSTIVARVYNRIRSGDSWFDGTEEDIKLWQEAQRLIEP